MPYSTLWRSWTGTRARFHAGGSRTSWNETVFATGSRTGSNDFCVEALNKAIHKFVPPEITTMDQAGQLISFGWTDRLRQSGVRISMDGKGVRKLTPNTIFIEMLWRTLTYERVHLHARQTGSETKAAIRKWMTFCNHQRPHSANPISRCNEQLKLRQIPSRRRDVAQTYHAWLVMYGRRVLGRNSRSAPEASHSQQRSCHPYRHRHDSGRPVLSKILRLLRCLLGSPRVLPPARPCVQSRCKVLPYRPAINFATSG